MQNIAPPRKFGQSATPAPGQAVQGGPPGAGVRGGIPGLVDRVRGRPQTQAPMPPPMQSAMPPDAQPMMDEVQVTGQPTMATLQGQMADVQRGQQYGALQQMTNKPAPSRQLMQAQALRRGQR